ncbi:DNA-binding PadR family transcriptional regulator [Rhodobium orientis]|uniref:PadR family transcriptional regulator n=1 Tax=Rhodobium orientis TaxID=34017 RepID=A0A327JR48_9HYPH|nr:PadR family transcriptional regulator [Rhodobium orientis]MBB4302239.1 DNA-binding PadR family transcriptional regulator [Rhodobium orientis]MBK5948950.1 PadR family transcriptional regulator [Rhodobium orientis]RAI28949.1 PadR family transcriptional regulator [Rhodobium orientis]
MRNQRNPGGRGRHFTQNHQHEECLPHEHAHGFGHGHGHRHGGGGGRHGSGRLFDYGELRLLVLAMIEDAPRHGYELIKAIEERFAGSYSPSPGVIYPTLAWLDDMGYAEVEASEGSRKSYHLTEEGAAFLAANRAAADALLTRTGDGHGGRHAGAPAPVVRAMENLKTALRLRLREGPVDPQAAKAMAAAIDRAAAEVENAE